MTKIPARVQLRRPSQPGALPAIAIARLECVHELLGALLRRNVPAQFRLSLRTRPAASKKTSPPLPLVCSGGTHYLSLDLAWASHVHAADHLPSSAGQSGTSLQIGTRPEVEIRLYASTETEIGANTMTWENAAQLVGTKATLGWVGAAAGLTPSPASTAKSDFSRLQVAALKGDERVTEDTRRTP